MPSIAIFVSLIMLVLSACEVEYQLYPVEGFITQFFLPGLWVADDLPGAIYVYKEPRYKLCRCAETQLHKHPQ